MSLFDNLKVRRVVTVRSKSLFCLRSKCCSSWSLTREQLLASAEVLLGKPELCTVVSAGSFMWQGHFRCTKWPCGPGGTLDGTGERDTGARLDLLLLPVHLLHLSVTESCKVWVFLLLCCTENWDNTQRVQKNMKIYLVVYSTIRFAFWLDFFFARFLPCFTCIPQSETRDGWGSFFVFY